MQDRRIPIHRRYKQAVIIVTTAVVPRAFRAAGLVCMQIAANGFPRTFLLGAWVHKEAGGPCVLRPRRGRPSPSPSTASASTVAVQPRATRVCLTNTKQGQMHSLESRLSFLACGQGATLGGSGALEMIVDGTEKPLGQKDPSLTSPSLLYEAIITPLGDIFESVSVKAAGMVPSSNNRLPLPSVTGNTFNHNSSSKSFANKVCMRLLLPCTCSIGPSCCFKVSISATTSPFI